jgi:hypothetical protein
MAWVKIDDQSPRNNKMLKAGPAACWLWVCAIAHAQSQLTDGFVSFEALPMIGVSGAVKRLAETLVGVGLFDQVEGGYRVHDYHDHNDTRASALERQRLLKEARSSAGKSGAKARWQTDGKSIATGNGTTIAPSRPIPSLKREEAAPLTDGRSKRPIFTGQRFTVFEWQLDGLCRLLGPSMEAFDLHSFFFDLDARAVKTVQIIPQRDGGAWLSAQVLAEAKRRGLTVAASKVRPEDDRKSTVPNVAQTAVLLRRMNE